MVGEIDCGCFLCGECYDNWQELTTEETHNRWPLVLFVSIFVFLWCKLGYRKTTAPILKCPNCRKPCEVVENARADAALLRIMGNDDAVPLHFFLFLV